MGLGSLSKAWKPQWSSEHSSWEIGQSSVVLKEWRASPNVRWMESMGPSS